MPTQQHLLLLVNTSTALFIISRLCTGFSAVISLANDPLTSPLISRNETFSEWVKFSVSLRTYVALFSSFPALNVSTLLDSRQKRFVRLQSQKRCWKTQDVSSRRVENVLSFVPSILSLACLVSSLAKQKCKRSSVLWKENHRSRFSSAQAP